MGFICYGSQMIVLYIRRRATCWMDGFIRRQVCRQQGEQWNLGGAASAGHELRAIGYGTATGTPNRGKHMWAQRWALKLDSWPLLTQCVTFTDCASVPHLRNADSNRTHPKDMGEYYLMRIK